MANSPFDIVEIQLLDDCLSHRSYTVRFYDDTINTIVTSDPTFVTDWISTLLVLHPHPRVLGLAGERRHDDTHVSSGSGGIGTQILDLNTLPSESMDLDAHNPNLNILPSESTDIDRHLTNPNTLPYESADDTSLTLTVPPIPLPSESATNRRVRNPVATLHLCFKDHCLIFQLIHAPLIPPALLNLLNNRNHKFVGVRIERLLKMIAADYVLSLNVNAADLRNLAAAVYGRDWEEARSAGLRVLSRRVLSREVEKPRDVMMSPWDNEELTLDQVQYACINAYVCFQIGKTFNIV